VVPSAKPVPVPGPRHNRLLAIDLAVTGSVMVQRRPDEEEKRTRIGIRSKKLGDIVVRA